MSEAIILSNIVSVHDDRGFPLFADELIYSLTIVMHSWEVRQSQMPSQAITKKSWSLLIFTTLTSGTQVII